jgi:tetratricopeptide (TPR) repeat protein
MTSPITDILSPTRAIQAALQAHPAFKFAVVVLGLAGAVALALKYGPSPATLVFGIILLVVLMVLFLVFAQASAASKVHFALPSAVLIWSFLTLAILTATLLFTSTFFDVPLPFKTKLVQGLGLEPKPAPSPTPPGSPQETAAAMEKALGLLAVGRSDEAIPLLEYVTRIDPRNSRAYSALGYSMEARGRIDEAIKADRRAIELDGMNVEAHWNLGNALYNKGDYEGAASSHRRALQISPSYTNAYYGLGNALMKLNRVEEAQKEYEKARDPSKRQ